MTSHITNEGSKGEKLAQRISLILARLHQGDRIDKHQLAQEHGVDVRTIERDLGERLAGIVERDNEGRWQLTIAARSTIPAGHLHEYARLSGTDKLFPDNSLRYLVEQLNVPETRRSVRVYSVSREELDECSVFPAFQAAISGRHPCRFLYKDKPRSVNPYRLIHQGGVWYLAAEEGELLKNFSIALVRELVVDEKAQFMFKDIHVDYINAKDDVWFTTSTTEALLRVAPEVAHYFIRQPLLPRQQQRLDADGSLLVTARISHPNQLLPLVRHWIPHVRILAPAEWHEELLESLKKVIRMWEE